MESDEGGRIDVNQEFQKYFDHGIELRVVDKPRMNHDCVGSHGGGVSSLDREGASADTQTAVTKMNEIFSCATVQLPCRVGKVCKSFCCGGLSILDRVGDGV